MVASPYTNPAFVGLVVALPSTLLGWLAYRQSQKVDAIAEQAGIATVESGTVGHAIDGLNKLVAALQADNGVLREQIAELRRQVAELSGRFPPTDPSPKGATP